jgi:hypothetical protein
MAYHQTDKQGNSVYIERIGFLNVEKLFKVTTEDRMFLYAMKGYEMLTRLIQPACSVIAGRKVNQGVTILDMEGFTLGHMTE